MTRSKAVLSAAAALVVLVAIVAGGIAIAGGSGDDEGDTAAPTTTQAPSDAPGGSAAPQGLGAFPPQFLQCLADRGVDVEKIESMDINELLHGGAVPPEVVSACFGVLHGGGGPR
jgi:hypothetical protein